MKTNDVEIANDNPFENCKLNRKEHAESLTSIIQAYPDGFVLAADGKWGTGKTTFMKMWERSLQIDGYKTILFNAWESDFTSEPMLALLGELNSLKGDGFENILKKSMSHLKVIAPALIKSAAGTVGAGDLVGSLLEAIKGEVNEYDTKKKELKDFKNELSKYIKSNCGDKPLVFIVDELDRCRPDYAVEVLEKIKHIFSVDGVVFVLSIDKEQLGNSIRGYYGSDRIDADEYLRRFIDLNYTLPKPSYKEFSQYLFEKNGLSKRFGEGNINNQNVHEIIDLFAEDHKLSLRQLEKMIVHFTVVSRSCQRVDEIDKLVVCFILILLKEINPSLYLSLIDNGTRFQDILKELLLLFKDPIRRVKSIYILCFNLAYLLVICKSSDKPRVLCKDVLELESECAEEVVTKYNLLIEANKLSFVKYDSSIEEYTKKIDLLDNLMN
ncbi:MAG: KAP family P-loop NTPase fold protein [Bacteroidales bacterium]